jgi:hypothetical protein
MRDARHMDSLNSRITHLVSRISLELGFDFAGFAPLRDEFREFL